MELYFVRHVQPSIKTGICYGQLDVPLQAGYEAVHQEIALKVGAVNAVYTSPLQRCKLLAQKLSENFIPDERLKELNFGEWEGISWDAIDRSVMDHWGANYITTGPPGGESLQQLVQRLAAFLKELPLSDRIVIVTHAGIIRAARHLLEGRPLNEIMAEKINYGGIYTFNLL
ncbi:alpha-ribazole phosphatase family protein [Chitinophaga sp.]|uniref:alpha-ribazole phosphatase family protein n=1 Tax=Chitinophaga sp. TaxID=1869181 RepID=UPI0031D875C5